MARRPTPLSISSSRPFDFGVFVALAVLSVYLLCLLLWRVLVEDRIWTGTDGLVFGDNMQYLAWIRLSARHVLIESPYGLDPTNAVFLHPGLLLSGGLSALGLSPALAYLAWKPIAVVALFVTARAFAYRMLDDVVARRTALVLALFFVGPAAFIADVVLGIGGSAEIKLGAITHELWPGYWLWGQPFTALAVALLPALLLLYERDRDGIGWRVLAPGCGLACSWLQPWQGATAIAVLVGAELLQSRTRRQWRYLAATVGATAAPLLYYWVLSKTDASWELAGRANLDQAAPVWSLVAVIAPLAVPALLAYRRRAVGFQEIALRLWPLAAIALYVLIPTLQIGTYALHSLQALSIPLAVLAVIGVKTLRWTWRGRASAVLVTSIAALLIVPGTVRELLDAKDRVDIGDGTYFISEGERDAFEYLDHRGTPGGVLAPLEIAAMVPGRTDRRTWIGAVSWTPDFYGRFVASDWLFSGRLTPEDARDMVRKSGARFVLSDCRGRTDLSIALGPLLASVRHFGCATVYEIT